MTQKELVDAFEVFYQRCGLLTMLKNVNVTRGINAEQFCRSLAFDSVELVMSLLKCEECNTLIAPEG